MSELSPKAIVRRELRDRVAALSVEQRHAKSAAAAMFVRQSSVWRNASVVMLFLSMPDEIETAPIALRAWQEGKTVVVPKVSWEQRRMLPVEISGLSDIATARGVPEPDGKPMPLAQIDLVLVPGLGFSEDGHRIGRGMGFYDRFLAQSDFLGTTCGLAFEEQVVSTLPVLEHDIGLAMLVTDAAVRHFRGGLLDRR